MHNNYYFLRQLARALQQQLTGFEIVACFSQEKEELVIEFSDNTRAFYLKGIFSPHFSALTFPVTFNRARTNSINLFPEIIGKKVLAVVQHPNERSFYIQLEGQLSLLFKMFGNRSNVLLVLEDAPIALFQKKFDKDWQLRLSAMGRDIRVDQEAFFNHRNHLPKLYPTFGEVPLLYLTQQGYENADPATQRQLLQQTLQLLENPTYYIITLKNRLRLSLLPIGQIRQTLTEPITALQEFVRTHQSEFNFEKKFSLVQQQLHKRLTGSQVYLEQVQYKILELEYNTTLSQTADLIMANLTNFRPGALEAEVYDFYNNQQKTIILPAKESPQKYAERLYKKNKNRQIELRFLSERSKAKQAGISQLQVLLKQLGQVENNRDLKTFMKEHGLDVSESKADKQDLFRVFETGGFKIWVGKNAKNNDVLTQQHTYKEDLWLHAKDVSGSHVVIKYQAGKVFPEPVIEKAAQLAAWYSKRKTDSLCPVLYTPKKFVRKSKGAAPGAVIVEREKVILVKPENPFRPEQS